MPSFDVVIDGYTLVPNPFWGGAAFPLVVFGFLYFWPWIERRFSGDVRVLQLLHRPRDAPVRTGVGVGDDHVGSCLVFLAGGADRVFVLFGISYAAQITVYRVIVFVLPIAFGVVAWRICKELKAGERVVLDRHTAEAEARLARMQRTES